ncbi:MAG: hypothetical protein DRP35_10455, partial [Candidatus Zixiibacteriota bacterium]
MNENIHEMLAGYVDGELSEVERHTFEEELNRNPRLQAELKEFTKLKEVTGLVKYADLPEEVWESYWQSLYRKTERGVGWVFYSIGAIVLVCYGLYELFSNLFVNQEVPILVKLGISALVVG